MPLGLAASLCAAVVIAPFIVLSGASASAAGGTNYCLDCHTTPAKLLPAIREIMRNCACLPGGSTEGEGEG